MISSVFCSTTFSDLTWVLSLQLSGSWLLVHPSSRVVGRSSYGTCSSCLRHVRRKYLIFFCLSYGFPNHNPYCIYCFLFSNHFSLFVLISFLCCPVILFVFSILQIHPRTGRIKLLRSLDREAQSMYELVIEAYGQPPRDLSQRTVTPQYKQLLRLAQLNSRSFHRHSSTTRIVIRVTDENDNAPVFTSPGDYVHAADAANRDEPNASRLDVWFGKDGYHLFIPEDMPEGAYLVTLSARDADEGANALLAYSLFGNPKDVECFSVDQLTGVVKLATNCVLTERRGTSLRLTAWAVDHGQPQQSANTSFVVNVLAIRLNMFPPRFDLLPALYSGWVGENMPPGSLVSLNKTVKRPLQLKATDPEGYDVTLSVTGGSGLGYFYLDDNGTYAVGCRTVCSYHW